MELADAAWRTAQASGALSCLDYEIPKDAATRYTQERLSAAQDPFLQSSSLAIPHPDPLAWPGQRMESWKQQISAAYARVRAEEHVAKRLAGGCAGLPLN